MHHMQAVLCAVFGIAAFLPATNVSAETALDRINATNTIRCGYVEYNPALYKDLKTREMRGFDYDIMRVVGERLDVKIEYTVGTGWATVVPDLNTKKFDVLCSGFWVHPNVGKYALFSRPIFYQPVFVVARTDDKRFDSHTNLNDEKLKMVVLDGDNPVNIAKADFPKASVLTLPNLTDYSQVLVNVADGKADFTIVDAYMFGLYNEHNIGKLRIVTPDKPIRIYPVSYAFGTGDFVLRDAFNATLDEMILDGTMDKIMDKYNQYPNAYYRATVAYKK